MKTGDGEEGGMKPRGYKKVMRESCHRIPSVLLTPSDILHVSSIAIIFTSGILESRDKKFSKHLVAIPLL
jgi:hypothetical protein